ncbi:MAG: hypothetical protein WCE62_04650 [Polyangiales bacterium]
MKGTWGIALGWMFPAVLLLSLMGTGPVAAQETADDAAAREYFERGRVSFEQADYEAALVYFRHAYRLSRRAELQYNIGVAADRLQREEEALEAFEHYLEETDHPAREAEVRERIDALRRSTAERRAAERALEEAMVRSQSPMQPGGKSDRARIPNSAIIGASALAAAGVGGVAAMSVSLSKNGSCSEEVMGSCVTQRSSTAWTWVYGGLGIAALAGSATWLVVSIKRQRQERDTELSVTPTGLVVSGTF